MASVLELYEKLKPKLGEAEARALLEFVEASAERKAATKEDLQRTEMALKEGLTALKADLQQTETALREEIHRLDQKIEGVKVEVATALREEIHRLDLKIKVTKADLLKWTFGFWIGNVAVLSGIMFALLRTFAGP